MYLLSLALAVVGLGTHVSGSLYVIAPRAGASFASASEITVTWLDDGITPTASSAGLCTVGLYTGNQVLVQQLNPIDVSAALSFGFTPNPEAGPDGDYYVSFKSTSFKENGTALLAFSPSFRLTNMRGSDSPVASLTSALPLPSSKPSSSQAGNAETTITVGTSVPPPFSYTPTSSRPMSTSSSLSASSALGLSSSSSRMLTTTLPTPSSAPSGTPTSPNTTSTALPSLRIPHAWMFAPALACLVALLTVL